MKDILNIRLIINIIILICCFLLEIKITEGPLSIGVIIFTFINGLCACLLISLNYKICEIVEKNKHKRK